MIYRISTTAVGTPQCPVSGLSHVPTFLIVAMFMFFLSGAVPLFSQEETFKPLSEGAPVRYRHEILEQARNAKRDSLSAPHPGSVEKVMLFMEQSRILNNLRYGYYRFFLKFGGLSSNANVSLGFRYVHDEFIRRSKLWWAVSFSKNRYQQYELGFDTQPFSTIPVTLDIHSRYRNFPEEEYFGLGQGSTLDNRSNYRLEDFRTDIGAGVTFFSHLKTGVRGGLIRSRTGGGTSDVVSPLEKVFTPDQALGFSESMEHFTLGLEAALDLRDSPGNPRSGAAFFLDYTLYDGEQGDKYDFLMTNAEFQSYLPFFRKHRVLALRVRAVDSKGRGDGVVPFHFLPYVGGGKSIRGYREYRFMDNKELLVNVEYRFEAFIGCDVALFGDFGQVQQHWSGFHRSDFEFSYGGGLRFNTAESVFMRFDVGHGKEGARYYLKFANVF